MGVEVDGRLCAGPRDGEHTRHEKNDNLYAARKGVYAAAAPPVVDTAESSSWGIANKVGVKEKSSGSEKKVWNTANLGSRLAVDAACAATAGGLVAPIITIVDKSIIENASGARPMSASIRASLVQLLTRPHHFLASRPFRLIFMLYTGTYLTANTLDTCKSTINDKPASSTTSGTEKFAATSAANLSLCLYKDSQFTKMFGTVSARPIPGVSYALFAARDCLTIFASFNVPPLLAPALPLSEHAEKYVSRASTAQFLAPAAFQLLSTPLHLLGLDFYNRNGGTRMGERLGKVRVDYVKSTIARMCRIVPAFGLGGVVNNGMRRKIMGGFE